MSTFNCGNVVEKDSSVAVSKHAQGNLSASNSSLQIIPSEVRKHAQSLQKYTEQQQVVTTSATKRTKISSDEVVVNHKHSHSLRWEETHDT